jgi:lipooligosaccharide transport system permease protein
VSAPALAPGALSFFAHRMAAYRHFWRSSLISSVAVPALYLAAMGITLGILVDRGHGLPVGVTYLVFLAPALLVAAAMQTAVGESSYPVMGGIKWDRSYEAVLTTPLGVPDILAGHLLFVSFRVTTSAAAFLVVLVAFGAASSPLVLLTLPAALLTGLAFATPITALAATLENDQPFAAIQRFLLIPMFLFSGTFFPITQLPVFFQWIARLTPLWHGVALARGLTLGSIDLGESLVHVGYLLLWAVVGTLLALRTFRRRLVT